jgi:hypothetical protein
MKQQLQILLYLFFCTSLLQAHNKPPKTIHLPLQTIAIQQTVPASAPDDISFCIVDLKFDGNQIKICEFGEGLESRFKGYDHLYGQGSAWSMLWEFLHSFGLPVFLVDRGMCQKNSLDFALRDFSANRGNYVRTMSLLEQNVLFSKKIKNIHPKRGIDNKACIIALRTLGLQPISVHNFKKKYPQCLILGDATATSLRSKYKTNLLFKDPELASFKPKFKICEKNYTATLAKSIIDELKTPLFVIKPTDGSLGNGIIIVEKKQLDSTLKLILKDKNLLEDMRDDNSYYFWAKDASKFFIVEEFATSKTIYVDEKPYDPTMRVIFGLAHNAGTMCITFFGAYWKLPTKPLDDDCSLTEKHKSHVGGSCSCSAKVDGKDLEQVKAHLLCLLPKMYIKMLQKDGC